MIKKLIKWFKKDGKGCDVIPRDQHNVSRDNIDKNALKVLNRLRKSGFRAYLVGGCIRDTLLGLRPKDFDIATDASPDEIKNLFSNCRLIGRRFRLAHIHFGRMIIEVATFRAHHTSSVSHNEQGMIVRDNVYGSIEEDVMRRDFTINALYYNISDFTLVDYVDGMEDIKNRRIKLIGNPVLRYREDPVRMLRAIRFGAKLDFDIEAETARPIKELGNLLGNVPPARIFEEFNKLFLYGYALNTYLLLCKHQLLTHMFPLLINYTDNNSFIELALRKTDERVALDKSVTPSFLIAVFNWQPLLEQIDNFRDLPDAIDKLLRQQQRIMAVPRRISTMVRDVWQMQWRLQRKRTARSIKTIYASPKFRAGYDFLLLRAESGDEDIQQVAKWWRSFVEADDLGREELLREANKKSRKRKPRRKKLSGSET